MYSINRNGKCLILSLYHILTLDADSRRLLFPLIRFTCIVRASQFLKDRERRRFLLVQDDVSIYAFFRASEVTSNSTRSMSADVLENKSKPAPFRAPEVGTAADLRDAAASADVTISAPYPRCHIVIASSLRRRVFRILRLLPQI